MCFKPVVEGFKAGCRSVIGLDGCFLKTITKGLLLSAIGKDVNDQMYPIAWAVVEGENENSWKWFIELLMDSLEIVDGSGWTIISDQQKIHNWPIHKIIHNNFFLSHIVQGLQNAVESLLPYAEHRNCARHIHANWKKKGHSTTLLKNMFWKAVKCTTHQEFERIMRQMEAIKPQPRTTSKLWEYKSSVEHSFLRILHLQRLIIMSVKALTIISYRQDPCES